MKWGAFILCLCVAGAPAWAALNRVAGIGLDVPGFPPVALANVAGVGAVDVPAYGGLAAAGSVAGDGNVPAYGAFAVGTGAGDSIAPAYGELASVANGGGSVPWVGELVGVASVGDDVPAWTRVGVLVATLAVPGYGSMDTRSMCAAVADTVFPAFGPVVAIEADDFLGPFEVWDGGYLGEILWVAKRAREVGDEGTYRALAERYWKYLDSSTERRKVLGGRRKRGPPQVGG